VRGGHDGDDGGGVSRGEFGAAGWQALAPAARGDSWERAGRTGHGDRGVRRGHHPTTIPGRSPLYAFDPETVGRQEQRAWVHYYHRQWSQLFDVMLRMTRSAFGLSLHQAAYASYINTQAQVTWARQGESDGTAEAYMREFYAYVREPVGGRYDSAKAAKLEVNWWAVHRNRDQYPDHSALAQALADMYAEVYQVPAERVLAAGEARAAAMDLSDQWIREGKDPTSPLLEEIATLLVQSCQSRSDGIGAGT
jgi:hypothetical protein